MKAARSDLHQCQSNQGEMEEFNRVLGGGVVPGSLVLIEGIQGLGKSTLLLQYPAQLSQVGTVLCQWSRPADQKKQSV